MAVLTAEPTKPACRRAYNVLQRRRRGETRPARQPRRGEDSNDENDSTGPYNASDGFGGADAGAPPTVTSSGTSPVPRPAGMVKLIWSMPWLANPAHNGVILPLPIRTLTV